ncbi:hypothetical protein Corgl_0380 [Coriobacterium glomerans PW2]|uniref:Uncharacterized protein n=1 Tax=Coriobacterium glomerans (strain ATCC 49209 / DSM 20642 / JCM 10262 / PW2) TaxID=700015 RepID=F2NAH2_CORGP|nr:hypothetical protein [Coriobacterium glomerans]AEB06499.1 hypothetical protein Corgl_0380 [Coriobacterium glomerans PW2]
MRSILALELKRAFGGAPFVLALIIGIGLSVANIALVAAPYALSEMWAGWRDGAQGCPPSFFGTWMGQTPFTITTSIFYYALPLLACIPYATSLHADLSSHFATQLLVRKGRANYFAAKASATFLAAGLVSILPLVVNIIGVACLVPQYAPEPTAGIYAVSASSMLGELFYISPWVHISVFLMLTFIMAGLLGMVSVALSFFVRNGFAVLLAPFALCVVIQLVAQNTVFEGFSPLNMIMPAQPFPAVLWIVALEMGICAVALVVALAVRGFRYEEL